MFAPPSDDERDVSPAAVGSGVACGTDSAAPDGAVSRCGRDWLFGVESPESTVWSDMVSLPFHRAPASAGARDVAWAGIGSRLAPSVMIH